MAVHRGGQKAYMTRQAVLCMEVYVRGKWRQGMQQKVLQRAHGDQHSGVVHMKKALSLYWWRTKETDVSKFVTACVCCIVELK